METYNFTYPTSCTITYNVSTLRKPSKKHGKNRTVGLESEFGKKPTLAAAPTYLKTAIKTTNDMWEIE